MKIFQINSANISPRVMPRKPKESPVEPSYSSVPISPLTFRACLIDKKPVITRQLAKDINQEALTALEYLEKKVRPYLFDLQATSYAPENPIELITTRAKSIYSIMEKASSRGLNTKTDIKKNITDLAGLKIIMRDSSREQVNKVIENLIQFMDETGIKILEIENKRPTPLYNMYDEIIKSYDYASPSVLGKLHKKASKMCGREIRYVDENTPSNYMAIHLLVELPDVTGEIQIMGKDVAELKEIEDLCHKIQENKSISKEYSEIDKILSPHLRPKEYDESGKPKLSYIQKEFKQYTQNAYLQARDQEPKPYKERNKKTKFLEAPSYLPPELDFNYLSRKKAEIDRKISLNKKTVLEKKSKTAKPEKQNNN